LPRHKRSGEQERTAEEAFEALDAVTREFSDALRADRCRPSGRFAAGSVGRTIGVLSPLAGAWSWELLFLLLVHGPQRFGELRRLLGSVSSRVLTDKLRGLEREGFVARQEAGPVSRYALAEKGLVVARHLHPIVFYLNHAGLDPPLTTRRIRR
jgi:DNA-binding HxlR family transcriptional regulator